MWLIRFRPRLNSQKSICLVFTLKMADVKPIHCGRGSLNREQTSHFLRLCPIGEAANSCRCWELMQTESVEDLFALAMSKLGLNLVGPYDRLCWHQQMKGIPITKNTKVKETTNMVDLGSKRHLAGGWGGRLQSNCLS